jgi:hypothetical protein
MAPAIQPTAVRETDIVSGWPIMPTPLESYRRAGELSFPSGPQLGLAKKAPSQPSVLEVFMG